MILFHKISECLTLEEAFQKKGKFIQEKDLSIITNAAIVVNKGKIVWIGKESDLPQKYKNIKNKISLKNKVVVPSFIECHTHSVFAGNRSSEFEMKFQGKSYAEIAQAGGGIVSTVKETRKSKLEDLKKSFAQRMNDFLKQGVTTVEVKSGYGLSIEEELKILKAAKSFNKIHVVTTFLGPHAKSPDFETLDKYFESILKNLNLLKKSKLAQRVDIFIEKNYFSVEQAEKYFQKAKELGFDIVSHTNQLSESKGLELSIKYNSLSCDHLNYLTKSDIEKLAQSETTGVLIPSADLYLGLPYPRAREMIDSGVRVALSTDFNPGSSPSQDLQLVGLLARRAMKMTLPEVISAWTVAPSFALGLQNEEGSLSFGKSANFCVLKNSWKDLFYQVGKSEVSIVFKNGKEIAKN